MAYVTVFFVAVLAGAAAYWLTLRAGGTEPAYASPDGDGFMPPLPLGASSAIPAEATGDVRADDPVYVPITPDRRTWQTRAIGVLGLLIAITLAAALLAFALYQTGAMLAHLMNSYAS
jgi:hypothetical protein